MTINSMGPGKEPRSLSFQPANISCIASFPNHPNSSTSIRWEAPVKSAVEEELQKVMFRKWNVASVVEKCYRSGMAIELLKQHTCEVEYNLHS